MPPTYTRKQLEKAQEKLPEELLEALFSVETADTLWDIVKQHNVMDERGSKMSEYVGYVLMGLMLPTEFQQALQKEMKLPKKIAEQLGREINRLIFYPVKPALEQLHQIEIKAEAKVVTPTPEETSEQSEEQIPKRERPEERKGPDTYQEPIE